MKIRKVASETTCQEIVADIKFIATKLNDKSLTFANYSRNGGKHSYTSIRRRFGTWTNACKHAKLKARHYNVTFHDLFLNLEKMQKRLKRFPKRFELNYAISKYSTDIYSSRFRQWACVENAYNEWLSSGRKCEEPRLAKEDNRKLSLSLRYQVLKRDESKCQLCGNGLPHTILHIDHIIPFCKGGRTEIENLQTLCQECNLGKGAS